MRAFLALPFLLVFSVAAAFGAEGPSGDLSPLTLDAALKEALEKNPELIVLRRQFDAARQRPAQEEAFAAPTFEAQIWQWPLRSANPADTTMYMFTVNQELPGRGKRQLRAAVSAKDTELAAADVAVRAREIVDEVKRTYADLYLARRALEIHLASVELLHQLADTSSMKYETGTGRISQQDVLKAVVEISKVHDDLLMLDAQGRLAAARLNTLLDRPPDAPIGTLGDPDERALVTPVAELQQLALDRQPELHAAQVGIERAQAELAVAQRGGKPDFSVSGGYMLMPRDRDAWTGSIGITWPTAPWSRGKLDAQRAEASAHVDAARARAHATATRIRLAVFEAYVRVQTAERRVALLRTAVIPQSEQTLESARIAYQTDRVDFLSLIDNQRTLLESRLNYYRALSELAQARADLERATGVEITPVMLAPVTTANEKEVAR
jgi:cobalt-zinc-cadmium efflux system outer membrane protein